MQKLNIYMKIQLYGNKFIWNYINNGRICVSEIKK